MHRTWSVGQWLAVLALTATIGAAPVRAQVPGQTIANSVMTLGVSNNGSWGLQSSSGQSFTYDDTGDGFNLGRSGRLVAQVNGVQSYLFGPSQLAPTTPLRRVNAGTPNERLEVGWTIGSSGVTVLGTYALVDVGRGQVDTAKVSFIFTNQATLARAIGFKNAIDTNINGNDQAHLVTPLGIVDTETGYGRTGLVTPPNYPNAVPDFFSAIEKDSLADPGLVGSLSFPGGPERPDKVIAGNWTTMVKATDFRYQPNGTPITDSGLGCWWYDRLVPAGQSVTFTLYYGLGVLSGNPGTLTAVVSGPPYIGTNAAGTAHLPNPFQMTTIVENTTESTITNVVVHIVPPGGMVANILSTDLSEPTGGVARRPTTAAATTTRKLGATAINAKAGLRAPKAVVTAGKYKPLVSLRSSPRNTSALAATRSRTKPGANAPATFAPTVDLEPGQVYVVGFEVVIDEAAWFNGGTDTLVVTVDGDDEPQNSAGQTFTLAPLHGPLSVPINLGFGWNLVALPFLPDIQNPVALFGPGTRTVKLVKNTATATPGKPYLGITYGYVDATALEPFVGYFVFYPSAAGRSFAAYGKDPASTAIGAPVAFNDFDLTPGWNIFGVDADTRASVFQARGVTSIQRYDPATQKYVALSPTDALRRGVGYYAFVKTLVTLP